jgi:uncharacterized protein DUF5655
MVKIRDWKSMNELSARLLQERTGENVATWNRRIAEEQFQDEKSLRAWLTKQGVTGYAQSLLVMERFGYPDFLLASAEDLIDGQYADRPKLRPIFDAIIEAAAALGAVTIQARKTYVSLHAGHSHVFSPQPKTGSISAFAWKDTSQADVCSLRRSRKRCVCKPASLQ